MAGNCPKLFIEAGYLAVGAASRYADECGMGKAHASSSLVRKVSMVRRTDPNKAQLPVLLRPGRIWPRIALPGVFQTARLSPKDKFGRASHLEPDNACRFMDM